MFIKWTELYFVLYPQWQGGVSFKLEKASASPADAKKHLEIWLIKLLHSPIVAKETGEFCNQFEESHSIEITGILRNEAFVALR